MSLINKYYHILFLLFFIVTSNAQNLVVNPSFETTERCMKISDIGKSLENVPSLLLVNPTGWSCVSELATADIFQPCNESAKFGNLDVNFRTPINNSGAQYARSGNAYGGFFVFSDHNNEFIYREYIQGSLSEPLVVGKKYFVSAYLSLADNAEFATDEIGFYFSEQKIIRNPLFTQVLDVIPQVVNTKDRIIGNKANWVRIEGSFIASGNEKYFTIGCFADYYKTNLHFLEEGKKEDLITSCFYYIDDVCVSTDEFCNKKKEDTDSTITLPSLPVVQNKAYIKGNFFDNISKNILVVGQQTYVLGEKPDYFTLKKVKNNGTMQELIPKDTCYITLVESEGYIPRMFYTEAKSYVNYLGNQLNHSDFGKTPISAIKNGNKSPLLHYYYFDDKNKKTFIPYVEDELDRIALMLQKHTNIKIKIYAHGTHADSLKMMANMPADKKVQLIKYQSNNRANKIAQYLISKKVDPTRIFAEGRGIEDQYGEYLNEIQILDFDTAKISANKVILNNSPTTAQKILALDTLTHIDTLEKTIAPKTTIEKIIAKEVCVIYGKTYNAKNKLTIFAPVKIINDDEDRYVIVNTGQGKFVSSITEGTYSIFVNKQGFLPYDTTVTIKKDSLYIPISLRPIEVNESFTIENILFEPSSYKLRSSSNKQLNKIFEFLLLNPTVKMGIYGHTDKGTSTSTDEGLQQLSEERANEVMQYLLEKGIAPERLTKKGFGRSKPIATNDTYDGMSKNRRTEFVILSK